MENSPAFGVYQKFAEGCVRGWMGYEGTAEESHVFDYIVLIAFVFKMALYGVQGMDSAVPIICPPQNENVTSAFIASICRFFPHA